MDVNASTNEVTFITNEVWYKASKKDVEGYNKPDSTSRYLDYKNLINVLHWGMAPGAADVAFESRREKAPSYELKDSYVIDYAKFQNENIERYKVIEAHLHGDRVTLLYSGLGSYTFQLKKSRY